MTDLQLIKKQLKSIEIQLNAVAVVLQNMQGNKTDAVFIGVPNAGDIVAQQNQLFDVLKMITTMPASTQVKEHTQLTILKLINELFESK